MFRFPISEHVMVPLRAVSVSLKFRPLHVHITCIGRARAEHHVVEIEKTKDTS